MRLAVNPERRDQPLGGGTKSLFRRLSGRLELSVLTEAPKRELEGLEVVCWDDDEATPQDRIFETVHLSLRLIDETYPTGLSFVSRSVDRIVVMHLPGRNGEYSQILQAAVVSRDLVLRDGGWWRAALTILHEATHGRLRRRGIGYEYERRQRIEQACRKRELTLARRMEDGEEWVGHLLARLHEPALSDLELHESQIDKLSGRLLFLGVPRTLVRVFKRVARWRRRSGH